MSPVSIAVSSVICGSFTVDAIAISVHLLSRPLFSWQVFLCLFAFILSFTQIWTILFQPLLTSLSARTVLIHCIIITHLPPSLFDAVLPVVPLHDVLMLLSTYPLCLR